MVTSQLISVTPATPVDDPSELWRALLKRSGATQPSPPSYGPAMEAGLSVLTELSVAPPRTLHSAPLIKSSPLSSPVRAMLEAREFGRRFDANPLDVESIEDHLPSLEVPKGEVKFVASDRSLEDFSLSVDGLLQHRKRLLARAINRDLPRRHVFVLGAGPAGLIAAVQLALRDHHVVVCEQREVYSRNRYIGVYKEVTHLMAALGMPERMTYDFSQYRGKRGIMLADIQTLLHGVALKLGVVIYTGAVAQNLNLQTLRTGEVELQRATRTASHSPASIGITRWHHDSIFRISSGVKIRFDTILEASGGRSGLRETLVGKENVVSIHQIGIEAAKQDPSLQSFFDDPEDHCAEYVDSDYGCPPDLFPTFAAALLSGENSEIADEIPCFVSNIDASIFTKRMQQREGSLALAAKIGDRNLEIPHDWVVLECRLADQNLSRYHVEGPLPQFFDFGGKRVATTSILNKLNPVSLLFRILYAMGVPFDVIDRRQLVDFYTAEASHGDASDIVSTWIGRFRGLRVGGDGPIWCGQVPGVDDIEYGIIGEALQNAWYRFGVGVDDSFTGAAYFASGLELAPKTRLSEACRLERVMRSRAVQILYHLFEVARNKNQGVIGSVLTEYYMEEQRGEDLAEARLREAAREGAEILAVEVDLRRVGLDPLLDAAIDYVRLLCCRRAVNLLESFPYPLAQMMEVQRSMSGDRPDWREQTFAILDNILLPNHRALLSPLFAKAEPKHADNNQQLWQERLTELAAGRYYWVSPWLRACALRALDPSAPNVTATLKSAASESDMLVSEVATATLDSSMSNAGARPALIRSPTIERVVILKQVSIFEAIPHELLLGVASLLTERTVAPDELVIRKGEIGDSLYVIAAGRVRVHDEDRIIREMSKNQFFGELSLLDSEPRSASVSAIEQTLLFRLAQEDFYSLIREQPEITRAINRALCKLIRSS